MTKTVRIHNTGGPEVLRIEDLPVGDPGVGEIRIRVQGIGLNRSEAIYRAGKYLVAPKLPSLMGYEACGVVEALGPGVQGHAPGDQVCVIPTYRLGEYGVYAQSAIVPARSVFAAPPGLTPVQASSIWMAFLTAYAIIEVAKVSIGDYVLIPAASSSVGLAAIQLANWAGAVPIALTRHSTKAAALREQGARHVVATQETDVVAEVMRITGGKGARAAFDPVGGPFVEKLCSALAEEGILFIYGGLSEQPTPYPHWTVALKGLSIRGWVFSSISNKPERYQRARDTIQAGLASGHLKPVIARTFTLDQIAEAHAYLESNQQIGKIVVTV
ncbi:MAG TPA: zinc-dependent alcohol dehydrogenase family protein [Steroidobacteraceae bacterium]|jgi:NADPH:quinone reductase-like Zn-dependent oxidoreductase|nr:zinc-dependent alcohol dehydrogenase family protein [Steroidobacteraceae bacterium]